ncbi:DUF3944 domain-containing protein [Janthinobacterium sp. NKUCC06_STL]|uniref:DUF3944 domain-containing protein n=1 Tax=Janthinobacterium sp. NKUCC06_STL TaxID=2842127 RepID=UPI001C5BF61B|nr:DUF3944 domain-containing protein [Janthinobacterium sp. NKUCC06_STL]MBW3509378.1 DUF3944 domain-containing protein [Janthinobacterium sp. NKUCC06_STL]
MGIKYRVDEDLAFLQYCKEEDLRILAGYLTHDKDQSARMASELVADDNFKKFAGKTDQYRQCWQLIAGELQHFGGDTIVNLFRGDGVLYKEILSDVCDNQKVKTEKNSSAYAMENKLLEKFIGDAWEKLGAEQRASLLKEFDIGYNSRDGEGLALLKAALLSGIGSLQISSLIARSAASMFAGRAISIIATGGLGRSLAVFAGPVGLAVSAALTVPAISGAAYRVTIPAVIQIAYMRRECEAREFF